MAFKLGGYLSRAATKACLLNRTATIQPTMPFALDVQKFEKKSGFLFFFSSSWFPETSGYFLPSLPSNKSSTRRTIYPYEMLNEQWKFLIGIVKCECWLRLGKQSILVICSSFLPPSNFENRNHKNLILLYWTFVLFMINWVFARLLCVEC